MSTLFDQFPDNLKRIIEENAWESFEVAPPQFECSTCEDLHQIRYDVPVGHPSFGKMYPCPNCRGGQALVERQIATRLSEARLPMGYQGLTFETFRAMPNEYKSGKRLGLACAELFVEREDHFVSLEQAYQRAGRKLKGADVVRNSIIFQGAPGLGKTGLAAAIVNYSLDAHKDVLYIRTQDFIESIKDSFDANKEKGADSSQDVMDIVKRHPLLIMDEFNMAISNEWRKELIENLVRYRYGNGLPTIFTCNASGDELENQWGERTASVLFAMAHYIPMGGLVLRNLSQQNEVF